jgi:hypothetical protein
MKHHKLFTQITTIFFLVLNVATAQNVKQRNPQLKEILTPFRMPLIDRKTIEYIYLDEDKDPDAMKATLVNGKKILWIDDDDDMAIGDVEGDMDNDCLMIDINGDGKYGDYLDLNIDYIDGDGDGKADYQILVDNGKKEFKDKWESHYMWFIDNDNDGVFGYVNWNSVKMELWDHTGKSNFFADYNGQSAFLKVHISTWNIKDLGYNWENPFLFYDPDNDGLTEMAIRLVDEPLKSNDQNAEYTWEFTHNITLAQITFDLDNDNRPDNELDFDLSLQFSGKGFGYSNQINKIGLHPVAAGSDIYFADPRWRHLESLVYPNHETAPGLIFNKGEWNSCSLVFDEDDDCHRWERVEFYHQKDPFIIGARKGGLDDLPQADPTGDRGEWDNDFSGKGNLYVSPLDGKLHLYGAETGYWRIDQQALFYQGWQGWRGENLQPEDTDYAEPEIFGTVKYEDTDNNGFFDKISYDMDGDHQFEEEVSLFQTGLSDQSVIIKTADLKYEDFQKLHKSISENQYQKRLKMESLAKKAGLKSEWYSFLRSSKSIQEQYHNGFWLSYYLYKDLMVFYKDDAVESKTIQKTYFNSNP